MIVREDFRRDGLAANFLVDEELMSLIPKILIGSKINIGYPAICKQEYSMCSKILEKCDSNLAELCVVGHARENHLNKLSEVIKNYDNVSANIWIPISDYFLEKTVKINSKNTLEGLKSIIETWKQKSDKPLDIAFADCTSYETCLSERILEWSDCVLNEGVRNVIICDTRGIGTPESIDKILSPLAQYSENVEFHPHNDNNNAIRNIEIALSKDINTIGTSFFNFGERKSMLDPRDLIKYGLFFNQEIFNEFQKEYSLKLGDPRKLIEEIYGSNIIVTGSQFRLWGETKEFEMKFGVTSDRYIASKMSGKNIDQNILEKLKNEFLYDLKKIYLDKKELKGALSNF
jgi:hypothetical protein